jgi:hypothetical protein
MPRITFRGKTYNSVFDMPNDIRQAYQIEKRQNPESSAARPLTEFVEMSDEIRQLYERARENLDEKPASSRPLSEFPKTEDFYRRSTPENTKNRRPGRSIFRSSSPAIPQGTPTIEPESGLRRLVASLFWALLFVALAFLAIQLIP